MKELVPVFIVLFLVAAMFVWPILNGLIQQSILRKVAAEEHNRKMELLREQSRLAIATGDALNILMKDPELARNFNRRLQEALKLHETTEARLEEEAHPTVPARRRANT